MTERVLTFKERVAIGKLKDKRDKLRIRLSYLSDRALAKRFNVSRRTIGRE